MKKILSILLMLPLIVNAQTGIITVFAGDGASTATGSGDGGLATKAYLPEPYNLSSDAAGNMYIATASVVRKVNTSGIISTIAGTGTSGFSGDGGPATAAQVAFPLANAVDAAGNIYIADYLNNRIRKIDTSGKISTFAGNTAGYSGDGGPAFLAQFNFISDLAADKSGNIYVADKLNNRIRKIDVNGTITTIAGNGNIGFSGDGGPAASAAFYQPSGICVDDTGNVYVADTYNNRIRKINTLGIVTTIAGYGNTPGFAGDGGPADSAVLSNPYDVTIDKSGNIYIVDRNNYRIRKVNNLGVISTVAGTGTRGYSGDGGFAINAQLYAPYGITTDTSGNIYYADNSGRIRKITFSYTMAASSSDTVCPGVSITYSANTTAGCSTPAYRWIKNGTTVGTNSNTYVSAIASGDTVICALSCASALPVNSAPVVIPVRPGNPLSISITSKSGDTICSNTLVVDTFVAATTGSGLTYQWWKSAQPVGTNSGIYLDTPVNGELITCNISSGVLCSTPDSTVSNLVIMTVDTLYTPTISISVQPGLEVCAGTQITLTAAPSGSGIPYKWLVNGTSVTTGGAGLNYSYRPANGDSIICISTANGLCPVSKTAASNAVIMIVDSIVTPTISISGPFSAKAGTFVTFSAVVANTGPTYKINWMKNAVIFATTTSTSIAFIKDSLSEIITAEAVPTSPGCYDSTLSNAITLDVNVGIGNIYKVETEVYPNPVLEVLHIDLVTTGASYSLQNIAGTVVKQGVLKSGPNEVSMQNVNPGIYILRVAGEQAIIKKVIKE